MTREIMLKLDYSNVLSEKIGEENGISLKEIEEYQSLIPEIKREIEERKDKDFYFMKMPFQDVEEINCLGRYIRENFEYFVVIGIGGSALGNQTLNESINGLDYNYKKTPKFFVLDNVDPDKFAFVLEQIELKKTVFNVITKSGSTTETIANFLIVLNMLKSKVGPEWK
ncbi:MAG: glucose-6-phosphate isomerase, partial [Candidatus Kryptonium sp.]